MSNRFSDPIPAWKSWWRKMVTIRTVSRAQISRLLSQQEYIRQMSSIQQQAERTRDMGEKTAAFWKMENLSATLLKQKQPESTLNDPTLPLAIRPIAHCGMGVAAVEEGGFQPAKIVEIIDSFSNPDYRLFAHESVGAMLALYEPDPFGVMARSMGVLGLIPLVPLNRPDPDALFHFFPSEVQRHLIAHGYGRMLYFKSQDIEAAIRTAERKTFVDYYSCVQGIAFAYSMVNNGDLPLVLQLGNRVNGFRWGEALRQGLIYALDFWEWMAPGFLDSLSGPGFDSSLVEAARSDIAADRARGMLKPFLTGSQKALMEPFEINPRDL